MLVASGEGEGPKGKRPAGWYSRVQREERRRERYDRRREREATLGEKHDRVEKARRRFEHHREMMASHIERAEKERVESAPRVIVKGITPLPGETSTMYQARVESLRHAVGRARMIKRWDHKNEGTSETHDHAAKTRQGPLARLFMAGHIDAVQLGWACEIASVAESIEADVAVKITSYEMRIDYAGSGRDALVEGIMRVRREVAYGWWRERLPQPKRAVLDMLIGEPQSYTSIASQYRMGKTRARNLLIAAIDLWSEAMHYAERMVDEADIAAAHAGLLGG
jgi:hypothetical protein